MDLSLTLCYLLIRFVVPITLGAAVILRQNLFSLLYLVLLFIGPLLQTPNPQNVLNGSNGYYLIAIICLSAIINSAHIIFQVILFILTNYKTSIDYCSTIGQVYNLIGFHRYNDLSVFNILRLSCLDFVVLLVTCMVYAFCVRSYNAKLAKDSSRENISRPNRRQTEAGFSVESMSLQVARHVYERQHHLNKKRQMREKADRLTYFLVEAIFCMLLCAAAILEPSIISSVYFLYFLFLGTWFAFSCNFGMGYHYFRIFISSFVLVHFTLLFLYQFLIIRPVLPPDNINARLFGFIEYVNTTCDNVREFDFNSYHFVRFLHPFTLILLYFVSVSLIRSVLISKKYLASELSLPPATVFFPFPSFASDRHSSGFLTHLLHNASSNLRPRNSRANSFFQENAALMYQSLLQDDKMGRSYQSTKNGGVQVAAVSGAGATAATATTTTATASTTATTNRPPPLDPETALKALETSSNAHSSYSVCTPSAPNTPNAVGPHSAASHPHESKFGLFFSQIINMVKHGSYVITLIVMMTWSITYHSWLSFALLLASCVIWMMPNSRQFCLRSSPVLVAYAILLLIGQYVYSLNLDDQELPISIGRVSISEIGFRKYGQFSYQPLFIKIFYTLFFWITLRQYSETFGRRETTYDVSQGLFPPLFNITGSAAAQAGPSRQMSVAPAPMAYKSEIFDWLVKFCHELLIKYWIWVVATMLMIMSLSGSKVVIYRIVYMFLFLTFTIMFQLSLKWWRKLMYPFWLIVILYSMIILIAIYTYQFNNFPNYWWDYLRINKDLQEDLGLVVYDNDAFVLFNELLTPTFFIIITIIQVHFVHRDFLEFSNIDGIIVQIQHPVSETTSAIDGVPKEEDANVSSSKTSFDHSDVKLDIDMSQSDLSSLQTVISKKPTKRPMSPRIQDTQMASFSESFKEHQAKETPKQSFLNEMTDLAIKCYHYIQALIFSLMIVFWRLLEIHILKVIFLCTVIIAMKDVCAMNVLFVCLTVFLMVFSKFERIVCSFFGIWAGILVLLKMLFQLNIAQRIEWHTNCTTENGTEPIDNRIYIGFLKKDDIFNYISEYILLIVILVFQTVIHLRQHLYRQKEYGSNTRLLEGVVFQDVTRTLADKDFVHFLKYTINYGFYKFGVEICLIMLTISIANRGDIFSVFYCIWLLIFILLNRQGNEKTWAYFVAFLAIVLPYQYLMCLGIPPGLCLSYPWSFTKEERLWYFLPNFDDKLPKDKLYLDFLVLFFASRQLIVFRLEKVLVTFGGSNLEAYKETTTQHVPDFFSFGNSVFDSMKSFFFFCFFWMTLAVLFLAGTTRINLFGLGYVLGSFIFLWTGNEFYLKPIKVIFKSWKSIIAYTCITMLLKSIMQLFVGPMLNYNLCWLIQLLGIRNYGLTRSTLLADPANKCVTEEAGLLWDGISFTFLLIQKRIFCSHYFKHLVREIKAQHFLASRGAELIHEIQAKEVAEQEMAEREVMEKIKQKMDRIKAAQQRMFADKARSIKYHKQDEFDYDISPYSAADETLSNVSACDDMLSQTLPTVYSPTPSIPTITSPQSATSLQPGYFEVYKVCPIRAIDSSISSATMPSFSFASASAAELPSSSASTTTGQSLVLNVPTRATALWPPGRGTGAAEEQHRSEASSVFVSSTRTQVSVRHRAEHHQQQQPLSRKLSFISHSSSVKSGGYYMFEDFDSEYVDLNQKTRESLIPDPEGNEIRNLAKSKGFTAFCSKIFKGEEIPDATLVSAETTDIGESSKDSAIVSVERPKFDPDMSKPTATTSLATTSHGTDISNLPSLGSRGQASAKDADSKLEIIAPDPDLTDEQEEVVQETYMQKISSAFAFVRKFFESILISATSSLNSLSRDYRFVAKRLSVEKKCLKKVIEIEEMKGNTHDFISDPAWRKSALSKLSRVTEEALENLVKCNPKKAIKQWNQLDTTPVEENKNIYYATLDPNYMKTSIYVHFLQAIFYAILSRSEVMCYITIVINQIATASILSLPLPMFAFLWGSLSVPRPSKSFWVTCITYIEVVVVSKYIFQFGFYPWNNVQNISPFWWPRFLGIEKMDNYANYDLLLLLVLFFHRFMLKSLGLWDISETEMKAYMTNAELIQSEIDRQQENGSDKGKKLRSSKKKSTKSKGKAVKPADQSDSSELVSSRDDNDASKTVSCTSQEVDIFSDEIEDDEDDESVNSDFNAIFLLMNAPTIIKLRLKSVVKPVIKFFHNVLHPPYRITHDVYSLMFLCDFINFFILVFGFYAFGSGYSGSSDVAKFLEENRIPASFLITLLIQFAQIIIDRAVYLRKYIKGKLIFQIIIVIFTHMWLFFILPAMTEKSFTNSTNLPQKLWYIFKCIYFLLSAYQIRSGYPTRILGNTFCKKYNFVNWYLFKMYMLVPFLYDLRLYMDWIWTDTSLVLDEWSLMEDIFVNLYQRKCELQLDEEFPEPRGKAKKRFFKYLIGGSWVIIIIALIWGPLGLFAFGRAVGDENPPMGTTFELEIGGFQPLFKMSVTGSGLEPLNENKWEKLLGAFNKNPIAQTFINGYDMKDIYVANLNGNSTAVWGISPPSQSILEEELRKNQTLSIKLTYSVTRKKLKKSQDMDTTIYDELIVELKPGENKVLREQLAQMIGNGTQTEVTIPNIFPNYLRAPEKGMLSVVGELLQRSDSGETNTTLNYRDINITMKSGTYGTESSRTSWWEIHDICNDNPTLDSFIESLLKGDNKCQYLPVVIFNDKVFIGLLAFLSGYGIIGIYTTFVFLVSRWVRGLNSESSFKVIYTRMPNVDRVLQLCLDIYLVRESREFELEEDLYAKLIFLYRDPQLLIRWTRLPEDISNVNPAVPSVYQT